MQLTAANNPLRVVCSCGRAPCQSSATVTGEHNKAVSPWLNLSHRARTAASRARETSIRTSESIRTAFKTRFSADVSLCEAGGHKRWNPANLSDPSRCLRTPAWPACGERVSSRTCRGRPGEQVQKWTCPVAATGRAAPSRCPRADKAVCVS